MWKSIWNRISFIGAHDTSEQERRSIVLLNRINFFIFIISILGALSVYYEYIIQNGGKPGVGLYRLILLGVSVLFSFFLTASRRYYAAKIATSLLPAFFLVVFPTLLKDVSIEYYFYYPFSCAALAMIPILIFPRKKDRLIMIIFVLICFVLTVTSDNLLTYFSEPGSTTVVFGHRYLFYKLAQVLLFIFVVMTVFSLKEINTKYENLLAEQNQILNDQKDEVKTQSEKLVQMNDVLRVTNLELAHSNEELEGYKRNLEQLVDTRTSALKDSEIRFKSIFENANDAIFIMKDNLFIDCNLMTTVMFDCRKDQIIGKTPVEFSPPVQPDGRLTQESAQQKIDEALKGEPQRFEWKHAHLDGTLFDAEVSLNRITLKGQYFLLAIVRDITERKRAEAELHDNKDRLQVFVDSLTDYTYSVRVDEQKNVLIKHGAGIMSVIGYSPDELLTFEQVIDKLMIDEDYEMMRQNWVRILAGSRPPPFEHRIRHKNGSIKWVRNTSVIQHDKEGKVIGFDGLISDITERKLAEFALKASEQNFKNIFDKSNNGILIVAKDLQILAANEATQEMMAYDMNKDNPIYLTDYVSGDQISQIKERGARILNGERLLPREYKVKYKDETIHLVETETSAIDYFGQQAFLIMIRDVTELREAEDRIMEAVITTEESERSRIAQDLHDGLGPILSTIKLYFQVYQDAKDEAKRTFLADKLKTTIDEAIKGVSEISRNISPHILRNYGFYAAVKQFINQLEQTKVVSFQLDCGDEREINGHTGIILYRAISELVNNSLRHADCRNISIKIDHQDETIRVDYRDDGKGFDVNSVISHPAKGSGVQNIINRIQALQGTIEYQSEPGKGFYTRLIIPD